MNSTLLHCLFEFRFPIRFISKQINYKILFYFTEPFNPSKGGVERVSIVLGKWLTENGCTIFYLSNKCVVEKNSLNHIYLPQDGGLKRKEN